jgi:hypothetical protein
MSTRTFSFFTLPNEFCSWMGEVASEWGLTLAIEQPNEALQEIDVNRLQKEQPLRFYVSGRPPSPPDHAEGITPARFGAVTVDAPAIVDGDTLWLASLHSKSDWTDAEGLVHEDRASHRLLERLRRNLKSSKKLRNPTWARNIRIPGSETPYRDVWFSDAAAKFARSGGKLRQRAVANVEFFVDAPG